MKYATGWTATPIVLGTVLLPLLVPPFAMIALVVVALASLAAAVALAGAVLATPYLLVRGVRRNLAERHESPAPIATAVVQTGRAA